MLRPEKADEAEQLMKKANKYWAPSFVQLRLKPDWEAAAPLYEKAALAYKQSGQLENSRTAYEKAAQSQEKVGSSWHAAKHLEMCAVLSKELGAIPKVSYYCRQASSLYVEAGRASAGAEALARGARLLEEAGPVEAVALYSEALDLFEADGKAAQAGDCFRQAVALLIRSSSWSDAVSMLMRFGEACDASGASSSQCKAYLGAVCVWLHAGEAKQAWQVYQDALAVSSFAASDEAFAADTLLSAYSSGSADRVRAVVQTKQAFRQLDTPLARLATKLPSGDVGSMGREIAGLMGEGSAAGDSGINGEDEDLT